MFLMVLIIQRLISLGHCIDLGYLLVVTGKVRYIQWGIVCIGFSDHLVVKPSKNPLNLVTTIGFSDLDSCDGVWS